MSNPNESPASPPPHVQIIQMGTGVLGVASGRTRRPTWASPTTWRRPEVAADLAGVTGTNPRALHRFMRTLASFGILAQGDDDTSR